VRIAQVLLENGADVDAVDAEGNSALILAVKGGHEGIVRILLAQCADLTAQDRKGKTAAQWAEEKSLERILKLLNNPPACGE
jgi:hypothetical protein